MQTESFSLHFLLHSAHLVEEKLRRRLNGTGISLSQARMIDALAKMGAVSQITLAREFGITPASMSTMTARLIEAGFVTRKIDPAEARSNIVALTQRGRDLLSDIHEAWRDIDTLIMDKMGKEDAGHLFALARRLRNQLGGEAPGKNVDNPSKTLEQETSR